VPATLLAAPGSVAITVTGHGSTSAPASLTVTASGNALPTVTTVTPPSITHGSGAASLTVAGTGFLSNARIFVGDFEATSTSMWSGATQIFIYSVPSTVLSTPGSYPVVVQNPPPGGGASDGTVVLTVN
jgi:hypothetical protein